MSGMTEPTFLELIYGQDWIPYREKVMINVMVLVYERWHFDFSFFSP